MVRRLACSALAVETPATRPATAPAASSRAKRVAALNFKVITVLVQAGGSPLLIWVRTLSACHVAPQGQLRHTGRLCAAAYGKPCMQKARQEANAGTGLSDPAAQPRVFDPAHPVGPAGLRRAGAGHTLQFRAGEQLGEFWIVGGAEQRQAVQHAADHRAPRRQA